ncbi:hypothetical protein IH979_02410 [Patescibacteria group bacterium]|nr:hypothetical protein [Patescibacteria group bacterium]
MDPVQGYTNTDVIAAVVIMLFAIFVIVIIASPGSELGREYDKVRHEDVRDYTEALFEMYNSDPETFDEIKKELTELKVMIGTGESCDGTYGMHCSDAVLRDDCLDLEPHLVPAYLSSLPVDPKSRRYSKRVSGYYLLLKDDILEVGACDPFGPGSILLRTELQ